MLTRAPITASAARTLRRRLLAALALGAFTLSGAAQATGIPPCPHHDGEAGHHAAVHHGAEHDAGAHDDHTEASPGHGHAVGSHAHDDGCDQVGGDSSASPADPHGSASPCDCEAGCALAMQAVALSAVATAATIADQSPTAGFVIGVQSDLPGPSPFTLPYATAPPRD